MEAGVKSSLRLSEMSIDNLLIKISREKNFIGGVMFVQALAVSNFIIKPRLISLMSVAKKNIETSCST